MLAYSEYYLKDIQYKQSKTYSMKPRFQLPQGKVTIDGFDIYILVQMSLEFQLFCFGAFLYKVNTKKTHKIKKVLDSYCMYKNKLSKKN